MDGLSATPTASSTTKNELFYVKWHFKNRRASEFTRESADENARQRFPTTPSGPIQRHQEGNYPKWRSSVQIMPEKHATPIPPQSVDLTKVWPQQRLIRSSSWRTRFSTAIQKIISRSRTSCIRAAQNRPRHGFSTDKMLQARLISIPTRTATGLGVNYEACPSTSRSALCTPTIARRHELRRQSRRATQLRTQQLRRPQEAAQYRERPKEVAGTVDRHNSSTPILTSRASLPPDGRRCKQRLIGNIVASMSSIPRRIQECRSSTLQSRSRIRRRP